jgi:hypothetical protein
MSNPTSRIFTIEVDGMPVVAFEASSWQEAKELSREEWFRADLSLQSSMGTPLATKASRLRARYAEPEEIAKFERHKAALDRPPDELELAYLVELDAWSGSEPRGAK